MKQTDYLFPTARSLVARTTTTNRIQSVYKHYPCIVFVI